jgi:hypothetical protein
MKVNSFMRMQKDSSNYVEKLNELMENNLICLGYIGEQVFYLSIDKVEPKEYRDIELLPISQSELKGNLDKYDNMQRNNLLNEFDYQMFEVQERKRQNSLRKRQEFRMEIEHVIFPCSRPIPNGVPLPANSIPIAEGY